MRILVTGATGFVASHLAPALAEAGHEVLALGHEADRIVAGDGIEPVRRDLREPLGSLPRVDAVVQLAQANVAWPEGAADLFAVNTASTASLLEHARRCGARAFVYASSASVYGFGERPFDEADPPRADDFYAATKIAAERLVAAYGDVLATATLRLVAPYGPGQRARLIPNLIARVSDGRAVVLNAGGRPRMNPIYIDDVVRVVVRALESDGPLVLNVAGDEVVSIDDLARAIGRSVGREPVFEERNAEAPGDLVGINASMKASLGIEQLVPLGDGLDATVGARAPA